MSKLIDRTDAVLERLGVPAMTWREFAVSVVVIAVIAVAGLLAMGCTPAPAPVEVIEIAPAVTPTAEPEPTVEPTPTATAEPEPELTTLEDLAGRWYMSGSMDEGGPQSVSAVDIDIESGIMALELYPGFLFEFPIEVELGFLLIHDAVGSSDLIDDAGMVSRWIEWVDDDHFTLMGGVANDDPHADDPHFFRNAVKATEHADAYNASLEQ